MSLLCLCAFVTLNKILLTYLLNDCCGNNHTVSLHRQTHAVMSFNIRWITRNMYVWQPSTLLGQQNLRQWSNDKTVTQNLLLPVGAFTWDEFHKLKQFLHEALLTSESSTPQPPLSVPLTAEMIQTLPRPRPIDVRSSAPPTAEMIQTLPRPRPTAIRSRPRPKSGLENRKS